MSRDAITLPIYPSSQTQLASAASPLRCDSRLYGHSAHAGVLAGVTLAALMIPLNIGYAQVAGLPTPVGLYAAIAPMFVFPLIATSRHMVASPNAPLAALIRTLLVTELAVDHSTDIGQLALAQTLVAAFIFVLFWFFRLGFLANFFFVPHFIDWTFSSSRSRIVATFSHAIKNTQHSIQTSSSLRTVPPRTGTCHA